MVTLAEFAVLLFGANRFLRLPGKEKTAIQQLYVRGTGFAYNYTNQENDTKRNDLAKQRDSYRKPRSRFKFACCACQRSKRNFLALSRRQTRLALRTRLRWVFSRFDTRCWRGLIQTDSKRSEIIGNFLRKPIRGYVPHVYLAFPLSSSDGK